MSTSQASLFEWKQEVNRRLAEHRSRKGAPAAGPRAVDASHGCASRRGAEAAARVAERFAHAPSYTQTLVETARPVRVEEARRVAVVAEPVIEPMAAAFASPRQAAPAWESAAEPDTAVAVAEMGSVEEEIPIVRLAEAHGDARLFGGAARDLMELPAADWGATGGADEMQAGEAEPIHGNLIEFPRELVATRKIRPRLAEGPYGSARSEQLSIFEVDPGAVSTAVETADAPATEWNQPEWSGIKLDPHPVEETVTAAEIAAAAVAAEIDLAPLSRRLLAQFVDATLIGAAVIAAGALFAANATALPGPRELGIGAAVAFLLAAIGYEWIFFTLARATPGMRYAHIGLRTFGNEQPSRKQRQRRLATMGLSVLPLGLGLVWSLFDEERLCWHDRLSQTYLKSSF